MESKQGGDPCFRSLFDQSHTTFVPQCLCAAQERNTFNELHSIAHFDGVFSIARIGFFFKLIAVNHPQMFSSFVVLQISAGLVAVIPAGSGGPSSVTRSSLSPHSCPPARRWRPFRQHTMQGLVKLFMVICVPDATNANVASQIERSVPLVVPFKHQGCVLAAVRFH